MKDPTRIPHVIDALRRAWEGQPDLSLPAVMGVLANRGIGWASTDEELVAELARLETEHPSLIDAPTSAHLRITTSDPAHLVTLADDTVIVRSAQQAQRMPGVWGFGGMRRTGPGLPLVIADTAGVEHRLGVVGIASTFDATQAPALNGLQRVQVGNCRWLVVLAGNRRCIVGQRIRLWDQALRTVESSTVAFDAIVSCTPGGRLVVKRASGAGDVDLGEVAATYVLEV